MQLEAGMRVRCVDAKGALFLDVGRNYTVLWDVGDAIFVTGGKTQCGTGRYAKRRFKPIVRVKAPSVHYRGGKPGREILRINLACGATHIFAGAGY